MGMWGFAPWDNDDAADWFDDTLRCLDLDAALESAMRDPDECEEVRAAAYLLEVLGRTYVWPGDLERLDVHLTRASSLLKDVLDPATVIGSNTYSRSDGALPSEFVDSVNRQIGELELRLARA